MAASFTYLYITILATTELIRTTQAFAYLNRPATHRKPLLSRKLMKYEPPSAFQSEDFIDVDAEDLQMENDISLQSEYIMRKRLLEILQNDNTKRDTEDLELEKDISLQSEYIMHKRLMQIIQNARNKRGDSIKNIEWRLPGNCSPGSSGDQPDCHELLWALWARKHDYM